MTETRGKYNARPMTPEEFAKRMVEIFPVGGYDNEIAHSEADGLMCDLLEQLGYSDGVAFFIDADKWYA